MQKKSVLSIIKDHYGQHAGALADGDRLVIPENLDKGKGKALVEAVETYLRSRIRSTWVSADKAKTHQVTIVGSRNTVFI